MVVAVVLVVVLVVLVVVLVVLVVVLVVLVVVLVVLVTDTDSFKQKHTVLQKKKKRKNEAKERTCLESVLHIAKSRIV